MLQLSALAASDSHLSVDHILFIQADVDVKPNPNEVMAVKYVTKSEVQEMVATAEEKGLKITPWFRLIGDNFLYKWWDHLPNVAPFADTVVHKVGPH